MELPADVLIHNETVGMKGTRGTLLKIHDGFYELDCRFGDRLHRVLLPVGSTGLISRDPVPEFELKEEIER